MLAAAMYMGGTPLDEIAELGVDTSTLASLSSSSSSSLPYSTRSISVAAAAPKPFEVKLDPSVTKEMVEKGDVLVVVEEVIFTLSGFWLCLDVFFRCVFQPSSIFEVTPQSVRSRALKLMEQGSGQS